MPKSSIVTGIHGSKVDFADLDSSKIVLQDITERLGNIRRFNGGTVVPYSVAQHSLVMQQLLRKRGATKKVQFLALMHDMTEAFMGDLVSPLKKHLPAFTEMEGKLFAVICRELGVINDFEPSDWEEVKQLDRDIRLVEWFVLNDRRFIDHAGAWEAIFGAIDTDTFVILHSRQIDEIEGILTFSDTAIAHRFGVLWRTVLTQARIEREQETD